MENILTIPQCITIKTSNEKLNFTYCVKEIRLCSKNKNLKLHAIRESNLNMYIYVISVRFGSKSLT